MDTQSSTNFWNPVFYILYHWNNNKHEKFIKYCSTWNCIFHYFPQEFQSKRHDTNYLSSDTRMDASVTRISSNKKALDEECAMIQGLKQVVKVTKIILAYFKRTQKQFCNPVRHAIWTSFVKKESIA